MGLLFLPRKFLGGRCWLQEMSLGNRVSQAPFLLLSSGRPTACQLAPSRARWPGRWGLLFMSPRPQEGLCAQSPSPRPPCSWDRCSGDRRLGLALPEELFPGRGRGADSCLPSPGAGVWQGMLRPRPKARRREYKYGNSVPITINMQIAFPRPGGLWCGARGPTLGRVLTSVRPGWKAALRWGQPRRPRKACPYQGPNPAPNLHCYRPSRGACWEACLARCLRSFTNTWASRSPFRLSSSCRIRSPEKRGVWGSGSAGTALPTCSQPGSQ